MARAYRCDKCGRFGMGAAPRSVETDDYLVTLRSKAANIYQVTTEYRIIDDSSLPDLCPKCLSLKIASVCTDALSKGKG